jgi:hypothetical protein
VIDADVLTVGAAMYWKSMRTQTVRRLRGRVDLIVVGSRPAWSCDGVERSGCGPVATLTTSIFYNDIVNNAGMTTRISEDEVG